MKKSLHNRVERQIIAQDAAQELFSELYPPIKRHFKTEHLMKGEPMETIRSGHYHNHYCNESLFLLQSGAVNN